MFRRMFLMGLGALSLTACYSSETMPSADNGPIAETTVFLVRHAEKQSGQDPSLTPDGAKRATLLADRLAAEDLTAIYSTDYARTLETAAPVSALTGLEVTLYDPSDLPEFAESLKKTSGRILVIGHSNTTPELVTLLGGNAGTAIDDATEFNRLYTVEVFADTVGTLQDTYGD